MVKKLGREQNRKSAKPLQVSAINQIKRPYYPIMENLWGRLKEPQRISLYKSSQENRTTATSGSAPTTTTTLTKGSIRQKVWEFMERNDIANFPRPVYNRIPNFKGAGSAGSKVSELPEFRKAKTIKVNPDKPQEEVRFRVLEAGKTLIVPTPRLTQGLFNRLEADPHDNSKEKLRVLASRQGIDSLSKPVPVAARIRLDLVVIGSVAVDRRGHRIGKGEGFADLEFSMAATHCGHSPAVNQDTIVVSTVHDCQVFDELPTELFQPHDVPVDIVVTPTQVIRVSERLKKPDGIIWSLLTEDKFNQVSILKEIRYKEKKAGKDTRLSFEINDLEPEENHKKDAPLVNGHGGKRRKPPMVATTLNGDAGKQSSVEVPRQQHLAVFVGRIPRQARTKDLKDAVAERGLKPANIAWKGMKGFAFIYFDPRANQVETAEQILEKLKDLKIEDAILNVEHDRRKQTSKSHNNKRNSTNNSSKESKQNQKSKKDTDN